jgi:excinuclease ABC subunit B
MRYGYADGAAPLPKAAEPSKAYEPGLTPELMTKKIAKLEKEMRLAAQNLEFEKAAKLRDDVRRLRERTLINAA